MTPRTVPGAAVAAEALFSKSPLDDDLVEETEEEEEETASEDGDEDL
ncbi:MAG: hypothetical protein KJ042_12365 [Deltaproteobacteria bacterium]|nr:hypothetical protein [Deltaproteobacteria bacterium]